MDLTLASLPEILCLEFIEIGRSELESGLGLVNPIMKQGKFVHFFFFFLKNGILNVEKKEKEADC